MKTREQNRIRESDLIGSSNAYKRAWLLVGCQRTIWDNESTDTSLLRHTATQLANRTMPFPYWGFLLRNNEEAMF